MGKLRLRPHSGGLGSSSQPSQIINFDIHLELLSIFYEFLNYYHMRSDEMEENHIDENSICYTTTGVQIYQHRMRHRLMRVTETSFFCSLQIDMIIDYYTTTHPDPKIRVKLMGNLLLLP